MIIRLLESAKEDLRAAWFFYESQSAGLGDYFLDRLYADIELLRGLGGIHSFEFGFHCMPAKRFPFAIFYLVEANIVEVYAVLDCRSHPTVLANRLRASKAGRDS